jgi:hypothetical protein
VHLLTLLAVLCRRSGTCPRDSRLSERCITQRCPALPRVARRWGLQPCVPRWVPQRRSGTVSTQWPGSRRLVCWSTRPARRPGAATRTCFRGCPACGNYRIASLVFVRGCILTSGVSQIAGAVGCVILLLVLNSLCKTKKAKVNKGVDDASIYDKQIGDSDL